MKKIVMGTRYFYPHIGGVETHVLGLCRKLKEKGFLITILTEQYDQTLPLKEYFEGIKIIRLPYSFRNNKLKTWEWMKSNSKEIYGAMVRHFHDVGWWYIPLFLSNFGKKFFITFHGHERNGSPTLNTVISRKLVESLSSGSMVVGDFIKKWYFANPKIVTYGACEARAVKMPFNEAAVFVGRLAEDTGIRVYLRAMRFLPINSLEVYGEGELEAEMQAYALKYNLPVAFKGVTNNPVKVLRQAKYVFTSQYLTILNALQLNRYVISVYDNPLKEDYLKMYPAAKSLLIAQNAQEIVEKFDSLNLDKTSIAWANRQNWNKLYHDYTSLWGIE